MCRKIRIYCLIICLVFISTIIGCSPGSPDSDIQNKNSMLFGQDDQYYFNRENVTLCAMAESENGYYFFNDPNLSYLFFIDKKTMKIQVLCNKPDCLHYDEPDPSRKTECNAFYNMSNANMLYYDGNLYLLDSFGSTGLYQVSLDGTQRRRIYNFKEPLTSLIIHRGYIYYSTAETVGMSQMEIDKETKSKLYRLDLSNLGKEPELLYQIEGYDAYISQLIGFQDTIYFGYSYYGDTLLQDANHALMGYDISNKKINEIKTDAGRYAICGSYFVYYFKGKTYRCGMDGSNSICLDKLVGFPISCEKYILTDTVADRSLKRRLTVYDFDGDELASVDMDTFKNGSDIYGCVGDMVFITDNASQKNEFGYIESLLAIDLNDVSKGTLPLKKIFEFVPKVEDRGVVTSR